MQQKRLNLYRRTL